jgi:hypothetical protein
MISESWSPIDSEIKQMRQPKITTVMLGSGPIKVLADQLIG